MIVDLGAVEWLPPLPSPPKILCVGLNYADHSAESGFEVPAYPTIFARFASSLIGHDAPIIRPRVSEQLDYEGEFVAVIVEHKLLHALLCLPVIAGTVLLTVVVAHQA